MNTKSDRPYPVILKALGGVYLTVGLVAALLGPVELYSFYLFSAGGRFHYEGFGFGSFMFGFIAMQIAGYYVIGAILIPLGYGHLRLRSWARRLALALLWCWLVLGVPIVILLAFTVFSFKELPVAAAIALLVALVLTYPLLPLLLVRFYRGAGVERALATALRSSWLERLPTPVLVLAILLAFLAVVLHFPILFNGLFPAFGSWLTGLPGIVALVVAIAACVLLAWGVVKRRSWAWWGTLVYVVLLTTSVGATLVGTGYDELLSLANFPPTELEFLAGVPLQGYHFAAFFALPLLGVLGVTISANPTITTDSR